MKTKKTVTVDAYFCDVCGEECGLPYYGHDDHGYGSCCDHKMWKAECYLRTINKLRRMNNLPEHELTFQLLADTSKRWEGRRYHLRRVA